MSISRGKPLCEMSISNRKVYMKIVYENSIGKVYIQPKSLYEKSMSNRKSLYGKFIGKVYT